MCDMTDNEYREKTKQAYVEFAFAIRDLTTVAITDIELRKTLKDFVHSLETNIQRINDEYSDPDYSPPSCSLCGNTEPHRHSLD